MLASHFVPHNEFHVFDGDHWQFSIAELRSSGGDHAQPEPLQYQYCLRAPGIEQMAFDVRDVGKLDREAAWDPNLRPARLSRVLMKSFRAPADVVEAIRQWARPLHAAARSNDRPAATI